MPVALILHSSFSVLRLLGLHDSRALQLVLGAHKMCLGLHRCDGDIQSPAGCLWQA